MSGRDVTENTRNYSGIEFTLGENESQYYWETTHKEVYYCVLQPKKAYPDYWAIIAIKGDRSKPLNTATRSTSGQIVEADPLYTEAELPCYEWLQRLGAWLKKGHSAFEETNVA
ncbi:MAG: hypothetical protein WBB28_01190 [Crinalium sp.]